MPVLLKLKQKLKGPVGSVLFTMAVNVGADGLFTAYLPENIANIFSSIGMQLNRGRGERKGCYTGKSLDEITKQVTDDIHEYESAKVIEDKTVIRYVIQTQVAYVKDEHNGDIYPNGYNAVHDDKEWSWHEGTVETNATNPKPFGFLFYARAFRKITTERKDGKRATEYVYIPPQTGEEFLAKLNSICSMTPPGSWSYREMDELDATEENAKFFYDLFIQVAMLNEKIKPIIKPKVLQLMISKGTKLLGDSGR